MVEVVVERGKIYTVYGPARVTVKNGEVRVQAAKWGAGATLVVPGSKSIPLYSTSEGGASLEIAVGEGGGFEPADPENPVVLWEETFRREIEDLLGGSTPVTIVVLGGVESGKTTAVTMMTNIALELGCRTAVIDGDVGQADIGPPTFVSMGWASRPVITLREIEADRLYFVGDTTPYTSYERIAFGIKTLVEEARRGGASVIIVDTDGWFRGVKAYLSKITILKTVKPDLTLIISDEEATTRFERLKEVGFNIKVIKPPRMRRERSRDDRRRLRENAYSRAFKGATRRRLNIRDLIFMNVPISGKPVSPEELKLLSEELGVEVVYAESNRDSMLIVVRWDSGSTGYKGVISKLRTLYGNREYTILGAGWERGLIASVLDGRLADVAPAIIEGIDYSTLDVRLYTPWRGEVKGITVGRVRLQILEGGIVKEAGKL